MQKHVVVIGAGFGGLYAVRELLEFPKVRVTLVDRHNYHLFVPLLYQVAIAGLNAPEIVHPARDVLRRHTRSAFVLGEVQRIDRHERTVWVEDEPLHYDYLIVASGSQTNTLGVDGVVEHAIGLKNVPDATLIRDRILSACEEAAHSTDERRIRMLLTFAVVGGGPTGVELAGALGEIRRRVLPRYYPEIDPALYRVLLIQSSDRVLTMLKESSSSYAQRALEGFGVELRLNTRVSEVTPEGVRTEDGAFIEAFNTIWTAGVVGAPIEGLPEPGRGNRISTSGTLRLEGDPHVYVVGDLNGYVPPRKERPYPQVAPMATQQGAHAARNIVREIEGKRLKRFRYRDRGTMVTVGRKRAVVESGPFRIKGLPAWLAWFAVHLRQLTGTRNRILVLTAWLYNYVTYDFAARLIVRRHRFPEPTGTTDNKDLDRAAGAQ